MIEEKSKLLGSLLLFTKTFFKLNTGREFEIGNPLHRESHYITVCRELTDAFYLRTLRLVINIPPGHAKSTLLQYFTAWAFAHYPDCQFIYVSYAHDEAAKNTAVIKSIIELPHYRKMFDIAIKHDSSAKDNFMLEQGGAVRAFGSSGPVTGKNAGLPNLDRFSGCIFMDDMHKPDEVHSDTIRMGVIKNYKETIKLRKRSELVPSLFVGHRLHEDDLANYFLSGQEGYEWKAVILKALDDDNNVLCPELISKKTLLIEKENNPYVFNSQYQQEPVSSGANIFRQENFVLLNEEPDLLATFITVDGAETDKTYNDPTVFEFWGIYKIVVEGVAIELMGLHLIDLVEIWVEPKDLVSEFNHFYRECLLHPTQPLIAGIEKKSSGTTLCSILKDKQGLEIIEIDRTSASGSKTARFLEIQPHIASKRISLLSHGKLWNIENNKMENKFIKHMIKITANNSHRHDDIADACYDAIKLALINKSIYQATSQTQKANEIAMIVARNNNKINNLKRRMYGNGKNF